MQTMLCLEENKPGRYIKLTFQNDKEKRPIKSYNEKQVKYQQVNHYFST